MRCNAYESAAAELVDESPGAERRQRVGSVGSTGGIGMGLLNHEWNGKESVNAAR